MELDQKIEWAEKIPRTSFCLKECIYDVGWLGLSSSIMLGLRQKICLGN